MISHTCVRDLFANTLVPERISPFRYFLLIIPQADRIWLIVVAPIRAATWFAYMVFIYYICIINIKGIPLITNSKTLW